MMVPISEVPTPYRDFPGGSPTGLDAETADIHFGTTSGWISHKT
jgi:hypothetical protein